MRFDNFDKCENEALNRIDRIKLSRKCSDDTATLISISMHLCYISNELYSLNKNASEISGNIEGVESGLLKVCDSVESVGGAISGGSDYEQGNSDTLADIETHLDTIAETLISIGGHIPG